MQINNFSQAKLVKCISGSILDVAVDTRTKSINYCKWVSEKISEENKYWIYIPEGFLHGFITLEDNTSVLYKCTNYYSQKNEISVNFADKLFNIDWGIDKDLAILSNKDKNAPNFENVRHLVNS